jgi:transposase
MHLTQKYGGDMPRYKHTEAENGQGMFLSVNLKEQLLPGTFEYMLDEIINTKIDISIFDLKYKNDKNGASAIPPKILLKLIIYGYQRGRKSSRGIWELNRNNIVAKALTGDMEVHWTTIADFISSNSEEFKNTFVEVLAYCHELELIGGETFAIDGLRLPSNASLEMGGTKEKLEKRLELYRKMANKHLERHIRKDEQGEADDETKKRFQDQQRRYNQKIEKINSFLKTMKPRKGTRGQEIQSNVTDNESAVIQSSKGYIQGYIGMAASDARNQIIISAQAAGSANECEHLPGMLKQIEKNMSRIIGEESWKEKKKTALCDENYFSEDNLQACLERGIEAIIPDSQEKRRVNSEGEKRYEADDFKYNEADNYYECPQGKKLIYKSSNKIRGHEVKYYWASVTDCRSCPAFTKCIRSKKDKSKIKNGKNLMIRKSNEQGCLIREMRDKLATPEYQEKYSRRIQIVEPVFANIAYCKGLNRFTLRGKEKVNSQWQLYCIVHNLGKCLNGYNVKKWGA